MNSALSLFLERLDSFVQVLLTFLVVRSCCKRVLDSVREDVLSQVNHMVALLH